jgi:hypothetical protein
LKFGHVIGVDNFHQCNFGA